MITELDVKKERITMMDSPITMPEIIALAIKALDAEIAPTKAIIDRIDGIYDAEVDRMNEYGYFYGYDHSREEQLAKASWKQTQKIAPLIKKRNTLYGLYEQFSGKPYKIEH